MSKEWDGTTPCRSTSTTIHKGHLIAARYGQGAGGQPGVDATFTYTNAVPQIGLTFNSGPWMHAEGRLVALAQKHQCAARTGFGKDVNVHVVVGVVPSTFLDKPRFFGRSGFKDEQEDTTYRLAFPEIMWTAACFIRTDGVFIETFSFWGLNTIGTPVVTDHKKISDMFMDIQTKITTEWPGVSFTAPNVFPGEASCQT